MLASAQQANPRVQLGDVPAPLRAASAAIDASKVRKLAEDYSCSTAWGGFVLGELPKSTTNDNAGDVSRIATASAAMREDGAYWQLPLTLAHSVSEAKQLATDARAPFTAVALPKPSAVNTWAQAVLQQLSDLATLGRDSAVALTPAV